MATIGVNGRTINVPGGNISIINGKVFVNGKEYTEDLGIKANILELHIIGDVGDIETDSSVTVNGTVKGNIKCGGSVHCDDVGGNIQCGGSVRCDDVGGDVMAGGSIKHG